MKTNSLLKAKDMDFHAMLPVELFSIPHWIVFVRERRDGVDVCVARHPRTWVEASPTDPETWGTFKQAFDAVLANPELAIGLAFPICGTAPE
jgi:primase-polymerase (primpol)-like protein